MRLSSLAVLAAGVLSQVDAATTIYLSGVVTDNGNPAKPIASAVVKLVGAGLVDTTDAAGKFVLKTPTTGIKTLASSAEFVKIAPFGFSVSVNNPQNVSIAIYNASGKSVYQHSQFLSQGSNFIARPYLESGIHVISVTMAQGTFTKRFMTTENGNALAMGLDASSLEGTIAARAANLGFSDTLVVTDSGYTTYRNAVSNAVDSHVVVQLTPASNGGTCGQKAADPKISAKAQTLLCYLKTHQYISGQTDLQDGDKIKNLTGRYPAVIAFDFYGYTDGNQGANDQNTQAAIAFGKSNGIVSFQWHWKAPAPGGRGSYDTQWDFPSALNDPNSQMYKDIDLVAGELKKINDAGVPVVFRPLHESNNNYMWWAKKGADNYKKLYQLMFNRMTGAGAHSILWVFNGMATGSGANSPMKDFNPGDAYDDIISGDYTQGQGDFDAMKGMGTNKVIAISETMNQINPANAPPFSYSTVWASRDWNGNSQGDWQKAMSNSKMISKDQLPDMSKW